MPSSDSGAHLLHVLPTLVIADDAILAAKISCLLRPPGSGYLPIVDGPRLSRPDADMEVITRNNAAARARAKNIIHAGLSPHAKERLADVLPVTKTFAVDNEEQCLALCKMDSTRATLKWGRKNIGIGVLNALREGALIEFEDGCPENAQLPSVTGHMIVCEAGEPLSEVIAANLAYAMQAGLTIVPQLSRSDVEAVLDDYYSLYEGQSNSISTRLGELRNRLRALFGTVALEGIDGITFITREVPAGAGFPDIPNTHLFSYPNLGVQIINGLAAEQPGTRGVNVAVLVDPGTIDAPEIDAAAKTLSERGIFVRSYKAAGASVRPIAEMLDLFPYDLLLFATHCGDTSGYRWTYEFKDSEGIDRTIVIDIALGIGQTEDPDILDVTEFFRFHSLDGVDWNDPLKKEKVYVGNAIKDFVDLRRTTLKPVKKEYVPRVVGSAAMRMFDNNILPMSHSLACGGTPILINNACVSWHELASRFLFANARVYIGTLFSVTNSEASEVVSRMLSHSDFPLPEALWRAQKDTYGKSDRRPYIMSGVYTQWVRTKYLDAPALIHENLLKAYEHWRARVTKDPKTNDRIKRWVKYYGEEIQAIEDRWLNKEPT